MTTDYDFRPAAYLLIVLGCVLAAVSAVVPNYDAGYKLMFSVFMFGIAPYYVYGCLTGLLRGWALLLPGIVLVTVHLWLTAVERFTDYDGYAGNTIYYGPLVLTLLALPAAAAAGYLIDRVARRQRHPPPEES
jgi:hypothetical protein